MKVSFTQEKLLKYFLEKGNNGLCSLGFSELGFYESVNLFLDDINYLKSEEFIKSYKTADAGEYVLVMINVSRIKDFFDSLDYLKMKVLQIIKDALDKNEKIDFFELSNMNICDNKKLKAIIINFKENRLIDYIDFKSYDGFNCAINDITLNGIKALEEGEFNEFPNFSVINSFNNTINISIDNATVTINNSNELSDIEKKEALNVIGEIKNILEERFSKKSKWDKLKKILVWTTDKTVDVGIAIIPLIAQALIK